MSAPLPSNESARLAELRHYGILDSAREIEFDDITAVAAQVCGTPISLISLVDTDRQWFKSNFGMGEVAETIREEAFCAHNILDPSRTLVVPDSTKDERFVDNRLVREDPNIRFYAGMPLTTKNGYALGSLCVIDTVPRNLDEGQLRSLEALGRQVVNLLELRRARLEREEQIRNMSLLETRLKDFNRVIAHDLKAPVRNLGQLAEIMLEDYAPDLPDGARQVLGMIVDSSKSAQRMVQGVLRYSSSIVDIRMDRTVVRPVEMIREFGTLFKESTPYELKYTGPVTELRTSEVALRQVLQNLVGNAIKFCDKDLAIVTIDCQEESDHYVWTVRDNGPGIPAASRQAIFTLFYTTARPHDGREANGHGVGLTIVRQLVADLGGELTLESGVGEGTLFRFTMSKWY